MLFLLELKLCRTLWSIDMLHVGVCAGFLGEWPVVLVFWYTCLRKAVPAECSRSGTWCKWFRLPLLVLCGLLRFMLGVGRRNGSSQFLCPQIGEFLLAMFMEGLPQKVNNFSSCILDIS